MDAESRWWELDRRITEELDKLLQKSTSLYDELHMMNPTKERVQRIKSQLDIIEIQILVLNRVDQIIDELEDAKKTDAEDIGR